MRLLAPSSTVLPVGPVQVPDGSARVPSTLDRAGNGRDDVREPAPERRPGERAPDLPRAPGSWTFAVIGDFGGDTPEHARVVANIAASRPSVVLTTGDNAYPDGSEADYERAFDPPHLLGGLRRQVPVRPTLGNHDVTDVRAEPYFRRFPELRGGRYYSFDVGDVHFVALDSTQPLAPDSAQQAWLGADLARSTKRWTVVYLHHPLVSTQPRHANNARLEQLGPLLARHGVDLVVTGHEHFYERWRPDARFGHVQLIVGNGGHGLTARLAPQAAESAWRERGYGHLEVEVGRDRLVGRMVRLDGSVADTFVVPDNPARG